MAEPGQVGFVYFPLFMNIKDKGFVVFGAGAIAARRLAVLLRYGAKAVVIAPCIHEDIYRLRLQFPGQLRLEERSYDPGEIGRHGADYVLAATSDILVNAAIASECRERAVPVNQASDRSQCDFYFPALVEEEQMVIGITSTQGDHKKTAETASLLRRRLGSLLK